MPLRRTTRWLVRGLILAVLATFGGGVWYAQRWVSPEQVHAAVVASLGEQFPGSNVRVGSAHLSVFGGITVADLSVTMPGEQAPFFTAPTAVIAHDKARLNQGRLAIRKIELDRPTLHVECGPDGAWKLPGLDRETPADRSVPTFVVKNATVTIIDRRPGGLPSFTVQNAKLQLVNDPVSILKLQGQATIAPFGEVRVSAQFNRETNAAAVRVELPEVTIGPAFAEEVTRIRPAYGEWFAHVAAKATLKADLTYQPGLARPVRSEVKLDIREGTFNDPMLPWPAEQIQATVRLQDGKLKVEKATAKVGSATAELAFETRPIPGLSPTEGTEPVSAPCATDLLGGVEERLAGITATIRNLSLSEELFSRLPPMAASARSRLNPEGSIDVSYKFARSASGWKRELEVRPNRLAFKYHRFRYPVSEVDGTIRKTVTPDGMDEVAVRLNGMAGGRRISIDGRVAGSGDDPLIDLTISGDDLPIDDVLFDSLHQEHYRQMLKRIRANGRGDFTAKIRQDPGVNRLETTFAIAVKDGKICDERFPYPLDQIRGKVVVKVVTSDAERPNAPGTYKPGDPDPDRVDIVGFVAKHGDGTVWIDGLNEQVRGSRDRQFLLTIKGKDCPLDSQLAEAVESLKLGAVWRTFQPRGSITLGVEVAIADRAGPMKPDGTASIDPGFDPDRDLKLTVNFKGPTVTPDFFPYELTNLAGLLRYEGRGVDLLQFSAMHGLSKLALDAGQIRFRPNGTIWANLGGFTTTKLIVDEALQAALPDGLKRAVKEIKPRGPIELNLRHMVVLIPPAATGVVPVPQTVGQARKSHTVARGQSPESGSTQRYGSPSIYWDGQAKLTGAALDVGMAWDEMYGTIACRGRYDGDRLIGAVGNTWIERGTIAKQPISQVKVTFTADPQTADPRDASKLDPILVRLTDLHGKFFRGEVGGEARVVLADPPQYRLWLSAQDVRLEDVASHHQLGKESEFSGLAQAKVYLEYEPDPKTGTIALKGEGNIDVPSGRMYKLPVMLELIKVAKLQTPDQTGFEEGHATFRIRGDRVLVDKLDLLGSAVSLGGSGELDIEAKNVKLEFYTIWSQTLKRWLTTPFGDPTAALSDKLFRIEATRTNGSDFKFTPRMVPVVTDPFRAIADRVRKRTGLPSLPPDPTARAKDQ
jgi:hypothetical protein